MNLKEQVIARCSAVIAERIAVLRETLRELGEGAANDSKSSAGDKHETSRAMMQLEQEKIGRQLQEAEQQRNALEKNGGTLIETNRGYIFLSVALGKLSVDGIPVMAISPQSPLGAKLAGRRPGETVSVNGIEYSIRSAE